MLKVSFIITIHIQKYSIYSKIVDIHYIFHNIQNIFNNTTVYTALMMLSCLYAVWHQCSNFLTNYIQYSRHHTEIHQSSTWYTVVYKNHWQVQPYNERLCANMKYCILFYTGKNTEVICKYTVCLQQFHLHSSKYTQPP